jgi:hypothetical protein
VTGTGRKAAALVAMLGGNAVPAVGLLGRGWPPLDGMLMYLAENIFMMLAVGLAVRCFAPLQAAPHGGRTRSDLLRTFFLIAVPFSFGAAVFIIFFALMRKIVLGPEMLWGVAAMAVFQVFAFIACAISVRSGGFPAAEKAMEQTLGRIFLLSLAVYLGVAAALFVNEAFAVPFVLFKTLIDIASIPAMFRRAPASAINAPVN